VLQGRKVKSRYVVTVFMLTLVLEILITLLRRRESSSDFCDLLTKFSFNCRPNTTAEDCKKKWYSLRTNYLAEKRKVSASKKSGAGLDSVSTQL
jgi:hypothetical protein